MWQKVGTVILGLLLVYAFVSMTQKGAAVHADAGQYLVLDMPVPVTRESLQPILDERSRQNWELIATPRGHAGMTNEDGFLISHRP
jgi:hypothetical protein